MRPAGGFDTAHSRAVADHWLVDTDGRRSCLPVRRWHGPPEAAVRDLLDRCSGPTVDVGCGPGRLTAELAARGLVSLGVDTSAAAVRLTRQRGGTALRRDVFDPLPGEGRWSHVPSPAARARDSTLRSPSTPERDTIHDRLDLADRFARYAVLFTDGDAPHDWLAAGEALSAVLLEATVCGLASSPMSDPIEVPASRELLRDMLGGIGYPAMVLRVGAPVEDARPPGAPRRSAADAVELVTERSGS